MITTKRTIALTAAGAVLATPVALLATAPAHADVDRGGSCGAGRYEFSVDKEGRGYEVQAELDNVRPGSRWTFVLRHEGKKFTTVTRTADREGDVDVERYRGNTAGKETFGVVIKRVGSKTHCSSVITVR